MEVHEMITILTQCNENAKIKFYMDKREESLKLCDIEMSLYDGEDVSFSFVYD